MKFLIDCLQFSTRLSTTTRATRDVAELLQYKISSSHCAIKKDDDDWMKKCMEHEVEGSRPRGRAKKTWKEVVREDCQACKLNKEDAMDRCKWRKVIREAR